LCFVGVNLRWLGFSKVSEILTSEGFFFLFASNVVNIEGYKSQFWYIYTWHFVVRVLIEQSSFEKGKTRPLNKMTKDSSAQLPLMVAHSEELIFANTSRKELKTKLRVVVFCCKYLTSEFRTEYFFIASMSVKLNSPNFSVMPEVNT